MSDYQKEFSILIQATLRYLKQETPTPPCSPLQSNPIIKPVAKKMPPKPASPPKPARALPKNTAHIPTPTSENKWSLTPFPIPSKETPKFIHYFDSISLDIPIYLFIDDLNDPFFLEAVARAISKFIAPAVLFNGKLDTLLTNHKIQLVMAPLAVLKKRFPEIHLHQFCKLDGPTVLPIADHYDMDLKQELWNSLKNFHITPPFF